MTLVAAQYATPAVFMLVNDIQRQINPAIDYGPSGQGTERRRQRELAKLRANKKADAERKKRMARKAKTTDVEIIELPREEGQQEMHAVYALGQRIGTVKKLGEKFVLFNTAAEEISERARARDLKKAAAALYVGDPEVKQSRQVRRRLERKGW